MGWELSGGLTMQFTIQKYKNKDEEQLKHLLHLCFEDETLLSVLNSTHLEFAYVAILGNELLGPTFAATSRRHPYCTYLRVLGHPLYRRLAIAEKLLSMVEKSRKSTWQTSTWETSNRLKRLYMSKNVRESRRTYMPHLQ